MTLVLAASDGLEVQVNCESVPIAGDRTRLVAMTGSTLTDLTNGAVQPLYHQVRNLSIEGRLMILYFLNPSVNQEVYSWPGIDEERVDLRASIRFKPKRFVLNEMPDTQ